MNDGRDPAMIKLHERMDRLSRKAAIAREKQIAAETRTHDLKLRARAAEHSEAALEMLLSKAHFALLCYANNRDLDNPRVITALDFAKKRDGWRMKP